MRLYSRSSEDALHARALLDEWADDGLLTKAQHELLQKETVSDLRTTNIFLRLVLFFFTLICAAAAFGLFFKLFLSPSSDQSTGVALLFFAVVCYVAAELAASRAQLYRYGIEEGLAVCSLILLCVGVQLAFLSGRPYSPRPDVWQSIVPAAGLVFSLWIWRRFGLWYLFLSAMGFAAFLPECWTSSRVAQHALIALIYAIGLACVMAVRQGLRREEDDYGTVEALLWLGIHLAINLQLSSLNMGAQWLGIGTARVYFPKSFYWTTWVVIWCLPPLALARGLRRKDRSVIAIGAILATLTLITNKPYLGLPRHTWDPMLFGILLAGTALLIRRWLAQGTGGIRRGFTAARVSGKDKQRLNIGSAALGLVTPQSITPGAKAASADFRFGGGSSGGGGAGGQF